MKRAIFYDFIRSAVSGIFGGRLGRGQVSGIEAILDAFARYGDGRSKTLAYALATAYHETGTQMVPVREGFAKTDQHARAIVSGKKYGKEGKKGQVYYGRGHVQLTWEKNYRMTGERLGIDLVSNPDRMLEPELSARVLVEGLIDGRWNGDGFGINHYLPDDGADDLEGARRTVNITDKWNIIAAHYRVFLSAIEAAGGVPTSGNSSECGNSVNLE
ncbi:MAG: glycoside hydrolase family 19 protein [Rhizobiaceae bacterium]